MGGWKGMRPWMAMTLITGVAAVWLFTTGFPIVDKSQVISGASLQPVSAGHELVQTITAPNDTISRVDLVLGKQSSGKEGELRLQLVEVNGADADGVPRLGETLREVILDTGSFDYTARHSFDFDQVDVTPGKTYAIRLLSNDTGEAAVSPGGWSVDNYNGGRLYVDGEPTSADLYFAIYHNAGIGEILNKMKPWRPFPLNSGPVIIVILLVGAAMFGWLLWVVAGGRTGQIEGQDEGPEEEGRDSSSLTPRGVSASGKTPPAGPAAP